MQEVDEVTIKRARCVVDHREHCLAEAGDFVVPLRRGAIAASHVLADLSDESLERVRRSDSDITLFKSVGNAVQDVLSADFILKNVEIQL